MKYRGLSLLFISCFTLIGCNKENTPLTPKYDYGVFLGAKSSKSNLGRLMTYKKAIIEFDEFSNNDISYLKDKGVEIYAYLSIGSLEKYRSYYDEFKQYTFMDYENWPDERWIDVSISSWQDHLYSEATRFKNSGASGIFMDNFDVYYIAMEEYECSQTFKNNIYQGCVDILTRLSSLDMKLIINSGTDLLERLHDINSPLLNNISCYTQECVFSSIEDYDHDIFGKQNKEDQDYYLEIIDFMKDYSDILLLEYTKDESLIEDIKGYCQSHNYYYYVSNKVNLE